MDLIHFSESGAKEGRSKLFLRREHLWWYVNGSHRWNYPETHNATCFYSQLKTIVFTALSLWTFAELYKWDSCSALAYKTMDTEKAGRDRDNQGN